MGQILSLKIIKNYIFFLEYFLAPRNSVWKMLKCIPSEHTILPWESMSGQHFGRANWMFLMTLSLKSTSCMGFMCLAQSLEWLSAPLAIRERCKDAHDTHAHGSTEWLCSCWSLGRTTSLALRTPVGVPQPLGAREGRALQEAQRTTAVTAGRSPEHGTGHWGMS